MAKPHLGNKFPKNKIAKIWKVGVIYEENIITVSERFINRLHGRIGNGNEFGHTQWA